MPLKFTKYFAHTHAREDRKGIRPEWIEHTVAHPVKEYVQADGRIRRWAKIPEAGGKVLRVVLLEDGRTVHNAFFDRSFREVNNEC
jgi:hypothetical protein